MDSKILGIDEAGRGSWAGPLVAAGVILGSEVPGLNDSKKLTKNKREHLLLLIQQSAVEIGVGWVHAKELDKVGLSKANGLAMERAVNQISGSFNLAIIDGNVQYIQGDKFRAEVKADSMYPAVSAASIVAKVFRDRFMAAMSKKYPLYKFEGHVGYGSKLHAEAIKEHGLCKLHRLSFRPIREVYEQQEREAG